MSDDETNRLTYSGFVVPFRRAGPLFANTTSEPCNHPRLKPATVSGLTIRKAAGIRGLGFGRDDVMAVRKIGIDFRPFFQISSDQEVRRDRYNEEAKGKKRGVRSDESQDVTITIRSICVAPLEGGK
jgi:hypothetical protein